MPAPHRRSLPFVLDFAYTTPFHTHALTTLVSRCSFVSSILAFNSCVVPFWPFGMVVSLCCLHTPPHTPCLLPFVWLPFWTFGVSASFTYFTTARRQFCATCHLHALLYLLLPAFYFCCAHTPGYGQTTLPPLHLTTAVVFTPVCRSSHTWFHIFTFDFFTYHLPPVHVALRFLPHLHR